MLGALYGRSRSGLPGRRWFLPVAILPVVAAVAALLLVTMIVDPYDLRPWGLRPQLAPHEYPITEANVLIRAELDARPRLVMVGASSLMRTTRTQLARAFNETGGAVNLAYPFAGPADLPETFALVAQDPALRRLVVVLDRPLLMPAGDMESGDAGLFRRQVFASDWSHAGDFQMSTIRGSLHRLAFGQYDLPEWRRRSVRYERAMPFTRQRPRVALTQRMLAAHANAAWGAPIDNCDRYPALAAVIRPMLAQFVRRGVAIDLVMPPQAYVGYYVWDPDAFRQHIAQMDTAPTYPVRVGFLGCVLAEAARFGGSVRVHALDNDPAIAGDLANYMDITHLIAPAALQRIMDHVARDDMVLTQANFGEYRARLQAAVQAVPMHPPPPLRPVR